MTPDLRLTALGHRFRQLRLRKGWTQAEAARQVGVSARSYQAFEATGHLPSRRLLAACDVLGIGDQLDGLGLVPMSIVSIEDAMAPARQRARRQSKQGTPSTPPASTPAVRPGRRDSVSAPTVQARARGSEPSSEAPKTVSATASGEAGPEAAVAINERHANAVAYLIQMAIQSQMLRASGLAYLRGLAVHLVGGADAPAVSARVERELDAMTQAVAVRYGLAPEAFAAWHEVWIKDVTPRG